MSVGIRLRDHGVGGFIAAAAMGLIACGQPPPDAGGDKPAVSGTAMPVSTGPRAAARPEMAVLGPGERRVALIVVPGDALVEVDGQPAYRRDGVIDLTGKVGDVRRVRVWKGAKSTEEKAVTIHETQPSPALVDLNEAPPPKPAAKGPKKPASFGGFDD
jgi:eukaryotic-like serine/threonine-protein kinase